MPDTAFVEFQTTLTEARARVPDAHRSLLNRGPTTVGLDVINAFFGGARRKELDASNILRNAGLPSNLLTKSDARIDGRQFNALIWAIQGEMNDIFMGFLEQPAKLAFDREQSNARFQCSTLGESIRVSTQFRESVRNDVRYHCYDSDDGSAFVMEIDYAVRPDCSRSWFHWRHLTSAYRYYSWMIGQRITLKSISFEHAPPTTLDGWKPYSFFGCEVLFNQPAYALSFDKRYLLRPVIRKSAAEHADYNTQYPDWFEIPGQGLSWSRQVEQALVRLQADNVWSPTISMIGAMIGTSARVLRRQLANEGTSYSQIKSNTRCELSVAYLLATDHPITTVAELVGFGEPGDFTRAFISWTGQTPSSYRLEQSANNELIAAGSARLRAHERAKKQT